MMITRHIGFGTCRLLSFHTLSLTHNSCCRRNADCNGGCDCQWVLGAEANARASPGARVRLSSVLSLHVCMAGFCEWLATQQTPATHPHYESSLLFSAVVNLWGRRLLTRTRLISCKEMGSRSRVHLRSSSRPLRCRIQFRTELSARSWEGEMPHRPQQQQRVKTVSSKRPGSHSYTCKVRTSFLWL